jgi:hypothetical protein
MTNNHILALSTRGIYVSEAFSSIPKSERRQKEGRQDSDKENIAFKPIISFRLVDPCAFIKDLVYCFDVRLKIIIT